MTAEGARHGIGQWPLRGSFSHQHYQPFVFASFKIGTLPRKLDGTPVRNSELSELGRYFLIFLFFETSIFCGPP